MIWITQWLCPARHCSLTLAWNERDTNARAIEERGEAIYARGVINRRCAICGDGLHFEHARTKFKTMEEATGPLKQLEAENLLARNAIGEPGKN